jgi:F-type H+-transporting ATPase subunit gamma
MANLQNIRRRIRSVKSIQKITNAMDMIARSRFNAARDTLLSNIPYVEKTREIIRRIMTQMNVSESESPFITTRQGLIESQNREGGKFLFVVIAADKGLAGAYSSNIFKEAHSTIEYDGTSPGESKGEESFHKQNVDALAQGLSGEQLRAAKSAAKSGTKRGTANLSVAQDYHDADYIEDIELITIGRKATSHFKQRGYNIIKHYHGISERPNYHYAKEIADLIIERFLSGEIIDVTLIYTRFNSAISCTPEDVTLLPLVTDDYPSETTAKEEYIYEPDEVTVLNEFLPRRIATRIYGAMLHSAAAELSSRMNAMSNATDNAQELVGKLNLYYNKVRQAGITNEINEIVGGANALE